MRALLVAALFTLAAAGSAIGAEQSPVGLWQAVDDDTKQPTGWFLITDHDGVLDGIIAKMYLKPGEDPNAICDQCKDDRHNHTWLGLQIIRGMKPDMKPEEEKWAGGTILDPRDGKTYKATMKVSPDNQTLIVRGYIGIELLGRNQYWTPPAGFGRWQRSIRRSIPNPAAANAEHPPATAMAPARKPDPAPKPHHVEQARLRRHIRRRDTGFGETFGSGAFGSDRPMLGLLAFRLARLAHQHRLEQRRGRHGGDQRDRQQLAHAGRARMAGKPQAAEGGRGGQRAENTARVSTDCNSLVCPSRQAMM